MKTIHGYVSGKVQGVWFRDFVEKNARKEGVTGYAKNLPGKRVEFVLQGDAEAVDLVLQQIHKGPILSRVDAVETEDLVADVDYEGFATM